MNWIRERSNMLVLLALILVALGTSGASLLNNTTGYDAEWRAGFFQNFSTEVFGAIMTFGVFELLVGRQKEIRTLKKRLVREAGSKVRDVAIKAISELKAHGWLNDENGLLRGENLIGASLQDANLAGANLQSTKLQNTNLQGASFFYANLQGTQLRYTNLSGADFDGSNLQGANLFGANLRGAILARVKFDEKTILPNATYSPKTKTHNKYWTPNTDMTRYTNPNHPDFWQPDWARAGFETYWEWRNAGAPNPDADTNEPITNP